MVPTLSHSRSALIPALLLVLVHLTALFECSVPLGSMAVKVASLGTFCPLSAPLTPFVGASTSADLIRPRLQCLTTNGAYLLLFFEN